MSQKKFNSGIHTCKGLNFSTKTKDIFDSLKNLNRKYHFVRYILPVDDEVLIPVVFHWKLGGKKVNITGNWDNWHRKISLYFSRNEFVVILPLFPQKFEYKFVVDGQMNYANNHRLKKNTSGNILNVTNIQRFQRNTGLEISFSSEDANFISNISKKKQKKGEMCTKNFPRIPCYLMNFFNIKIKSESASHYGLFGFSIRSHVFLNHLFFFSLKKIEIKTKKKKLLVIKTKINSTLISFFFLPRYRIHIVQKKHPLKKAYKKN